MKNFINELKWRGMLQNVIPGTDEYLEQNKTCKNLELSR